MEAAESREYAWLKKTLQLKPHNFFHQQSRLLCNQSVCCFLEYYYQK